MGRQYARLRGLNSANSGLQKRKAALRLCVLTLISVRLCALSHKRQVILIELPVFSFCLKVFDCRHFRPSSTMKTAATESFPQRLFVVM